MSLNQTSPASGTAPHANTSLVGITVQRHLELIKTTLAQITDPVTNQPLQVPDFDIMYAAAGKLCTSPIATDIIESIATLLGRASDFDLNKPGAQVSFPNDHALHTDMGMEWYYVCMHLEVTDPHGSKGRIGLLSSLEKNRAVGLSAQSGAGWTDLESTVFFNLATATVSVGDTNKIVRRNRNVQWTAAGGSASCSAPGADFAINIGPDSLTGSKDVVPVTLTITDGTNLSYSLTLKANAMFQPGDAFFLQGVPTNPFGEGQGTGLTPLPTPGIYYSWPQLQVDVTNKPTITVDGVTYTVDSGTGWIDHQLMMQSIENPNGALNPLPFTDDPKPFNGWCWQFFNLSNMDAFTGAAFEQWYLTNSPTMSYGYYVKANTATNKWDAYFIDEGTITLNDFRSYDAPICPVAMGGKVNLPVSRKYTGVQNSVLGNPISGTAIPWCDDGRFNGQNWTIISEAPADYTDASGKFSNGAGFLETVGFENYNTVRERLLNILSTGVLPCNLAVGNEAKQ